MHASDPAAATAQNATAETVNDSGGNELQASDDEGKIFRMIGCEVIMININAVSIADPSFDPVSLSIIRISHPRGLSTS